MLCTVLGKIKRIGEGGQDYTLSSTTDETINKNQWASDTEQLLLYKQLLWLQGQIGNNLWEQQLLADFCNPRMKPLRGVDLSDSSLYLIHKDPAVELFYTHLSFWAVKKEQWCALSRSFGFSISRRFPLYPLIDLLLSH